DVLLELGIDQLVPGEPDREALRGLYEELEFKGWLDELLREARSEGGQLELVERSAPSVERRYETVVDGEHFERWLQRLASAELIAVDTETTGVDRHACGLVGLSFAVQPGEAAYVPLAHSYMGVPPQLDRERVLAALRPILEDPNKAKLGQHAKFDINVLARYGIEVRGLAYDSMLESYVLDSVATRHDMDSLALK